MDSVEESVKEENVEQPTMAPDGPTKVEISNEQDKPVAPCKDMCKRVLRLLAGGAYVCLYSAIDRQALGGMTMRAALAPRWDGHTMSILFGHLCSELLPTALSIAGAPIIFAVENVLDTAAVRNMSFEQAAGDLWKRHGIAAFFASIGYLGVLFPINLLAMIVAVVATGKNEKYVGSVAQFAVSPLIFPMHKSFDRWVVGVPTTPANLYAGFGLNVVHHLLDILVDMVL